MATTIKAAVTRVVVSLSDGRSFTIKVDEGKDLQAIVFDRKAAAGCGADHHTGKAPGIHVRHRKPRTSKGTAAATRSAAVKDDPGDTTITGGPCYMLNGVVYCPT
jgi:hypothetical protein